MFWADKIAKDIIDSKEYKPYWVDDMKTPSGRIHVGSLRGVIIHDLVYKAILKKGKEAKFTYLFENHDPMDAIPHYLDKEKWKKYLGQPLYSIPSPDGKAKNYAEYFSNEFREVFNKVGSTPEIIWTLDLYTTGKMNPGIKIALENVEKIRKIYNETYEKKLPDNWYPFQVLCPKCGKQSTTKIISWDGENLEFECLKNAVEWTEGCGLKGKQSPYSNDGVYRGKLSWKVEWPVKWMAVGVTVEGAGKDHMSAGGSHDVARRICNEVLHYPIPYPVGYEFFLVGGKKMSSSKGLGSSAREVSDMLPPYLLRFLFCRTDYRESIDFNPVETMEIPNLFDEYDRCYEEYIKDGDENLAAAFEFAQIGKIPEKKKVFLPRFRDVVTFIQDPKINIYIQFEHIKGKSLTPIEKELLEERIEYARIWIKDYAPPEFKMQLTDGIPKEALHLSPGQKKYLSDVVELLKNDYSTDELQAKLFESAKKNKIPTKDAFSAIYITTIGKLFGPKAGAFLNQYPKDVLIKRFETVIKDKKEEKLGENNNPKNISHLFSIHPDVVKIFPSVCVGFAIIKGVTISKSNPALQKEKEEVLKSLEGLTTEKLGLYPEIISYRKLYKQMGVDWHSRRPSPEALLRRVALGKGIYSINTCVDAYNLIVMRHRVSIGAFDCDRVKFPTILQFAKEYDEILLLGEEKPTKYSPRELAYYDKNGGYNIDFNFRDARRTAVTENTKNLLINVDGIYDITPEKIKEVLKESVEIILKYCGGEVTVCE